MVTALWHIALRTKDIEETARFYREVMGFPEAFRMHDDNGNTTTIYMYVSRSQFLELFPGGNTPDVHTPETIGYCHVCFEVDSLEEAYRTLKERGAPIDREPKTGFSKCLQFWTHDPDGNSIEIMQLPPESLQAQANARLAK